MQMKTERGCAAKERLKLRKRSGRALPSPLEPLGGGQPRQHLDFGLPASRTVTE